MLDLLDSMHIDDVIDQDITESEEVSILRSQFQEALRQRDQFEVMLSTLVTRNRGLEGNLGSVNIQLATQQQQLAASQKTCGELRYLSVVLEARIEQHRLTIESMKQDKERLLAEGNKLVEFLKMKQIEEKRQEIMRREEDERKARKIQGIKVLECQ